MLFKLVPAPLKRRLKHTPVGYYFVTRRARRALALWKAEGKPVPEAHRIKEGLVEYYGLDYGIRVFVETGTYYGIMVDAMKDHFERIYSIEIDPLLYRNAVNDFSQYPHITILHGDSGEVLPSILEQIKEPALFWLDAHYSGGNTKRGNLITPIERELHHILGHPVSGHIVLIDDAHEFVGTDDYPTMDSLQQLLLQRWPHYQLSVVDNVIRITNEESTRHLG